MSSLTVVSRLTRQPWSWFKVMFKVYLLYHHSIIVTESTLLQSRAKKPESHGKGYNGDMNRKHRGLAWDYIRTRRWVSTDLSESAGGYLKLHMLRRSYMLPTAAQRPHTSLDPTFVRSYGMLQGDTWCAQLFRRCQAAGILRSRSFRICCCHEHSQHRVLAWHQPKKNELFT